MSRKKTIQFIKPGTLLYTRHYSCVRTIKDETIDIARGDKIIFLEAIKIKKWNSKYTRIKFFFCKKNLIAFFFFPRNHFGVFFKTLKIDKTNEPNVDLSTLGSFFSLQEGKS